MEVDRKRCALMAPCSCPFQWATTWAASRRPRSASRTTASSGWRAARSPTASTRAISIRSRASPSSSSSTRTTASCSSRYRATSASRSWCWCRPRTCRRCCAISGTTAVSSPCFSTRPWPPSALYAAWRACRSATGSAASGSSSSFSSRPADSSYDHDAVMSISRYIYDMYDVCGEYLMSGFLFLSSFFLHWASEFRDSWHRCGESFMMPRWV